MTSPQTATGIAGGQDTVGEDKILPKESFTATVSQGAKIASLGGMPCFKIGE